MEDLTFQEMLDMQKILQEKYRGIWESLTPENGRNSLLWMMEEVGEVVSIIKKKGDREIMEDPEVRTAFVEELTDVMMYYADLMLCYGISPEELGQAYRKKHKKNMLRDFPKEHNQYLHERAGEKE